MATPVYRQLPDAEAVAIAYLLTYTPLTDIVNDAIGSELPPDDLLPYVVVRRFGGTPVVEQHLDRARLQVDVWSEHELRGGGGKEQAREIAAAAQAGLHQMRLATHQDAVVTDVVTELGLQWLPDPDTDRPRYVFTVAVSLHP